MADPWAREAAGVAVSPPPGVVGAPVIGPAGFAPLWGAPPPPVPRPGGRWVAWGLGGLLVVVSALLVVVSVVAVDRSAAAARQPTRVVETVTVSPVPEPGAACAVMHDKYPAVAAAVNETNKYDQLPWDDPDSLAATDRFIAAATALADSLDAAVTHASGVGGDAVIKEYIAALRADIATFRDHANDKQASGVALFYNKARLAAVQTCGMK